jgi:alpha-D-xyloside xylohydrolase
MDATEPEVVEGPYVSAQRRRELYQEYMHPTALGSGSRMLNAYSLVNSKAIYEGQRQAAPDQRVFILTRSAFAGQQRYASASWSGDVTSTWTAFKKQIAAGLSFSLSGIPYWTMDTGGFAVPPQFQRGDSEEWFELNTRWFQWGSFVPLLRVHGQHPPREMWTMGGDEHPAYKTHVLFTRLRYRLLPYIYSLAGSVTHEGASMLRALVMDFPNDREALQVRDQYMFGPAFLVSPVTDYEARSRKLLLPQSEGGWYDFWTGQHHAGEQHIDAAAPLESMPLFIRAGSIVPVGPELQYTSEKPADPITLYVYTGRDATFTLYEDDGLSYAYEQGAHTRTVVRWEQNTRTLSIGAREGQFSGQLDERSFEVVFITPSAPSAFSFEATQGKRVEYRGAEVIVSGPAN